jgi:hypothetical protein
MLGDPVREEYDAAHWQSRTQIAASERLLKFNMSVGEEAMNEFRKQAV